MGSPNWTGGAEAIGLRLDKPLLLGKTVSYKFTYASTGTGSNNKDFAPAFYTTDEKPEIERPFGFYNKVGNLPPPTKSWETDGITFTVTPAQARDTWIVLHAELSSGIFLGDCDLDEIPNNFLGADSLFCSQDTVSLKAPAGKYYYYEWNTGETTQSISVNKSFLKILKN